MIRFTSEVLTLPASTEALRAEIQGFLAEQQQLGIYQPTVDAWVSGINPEFSRVLGARGWLGVTYPERYGGKGASILERFVITEELLAGGAPVAAHWAAERQIGPSIVRWGTEGQKLRWIPGITRGEIFFAIGMSEPDTGSDLASVRTRAEKVPGGWRVNGSKIWTSVAHVAHAMVALVRTSPAGKDRRHQGLSQLIIDLSLDGVEVQPILSLDGEHHFNEVSFRDLYVGDDALLGREGDGWRQCTAELAIERSGPERILSTLPLLLQGVETYQQRPDDRQCWTAAVSELVARLWVLRQMSLAVAGALSSGADPAVEAAMVKDLGTRFEGDLVDVVREIAQERLDVTSEDPLTRMCAQAVLRSPSFTIRGGTSEILRNIVARGLGVQ